VSETGPGAGIVSAADAEPDEQDFTRIYRSEAPWLVRFFRNRLGNVEDAKDLTQEAMLRYFRAAPATTIGTPQAYLRRIATNLLRDRFDLGSAKLAAKSGPLLEGLDIAADIDIHREVASREELAQWHAILSQLPPRTLEIFLLNRVDGLKYREVAERLGISFSAVNKHMVRAIAHIDRMRGGE
jgi:RNA polymerase sigma-70 factor (ECF subfamily)